MSAYLRIHIKDMLELVLKQLFNITRVAVTRFIYSSNTYILTCALLLKA